MTFLFLYNI